MRAILLCGALLCASTANAAPIPSAASGWYAAPERMCRLVLSKLGTSINVDLFCVVDANGHPTYSHSTADAFGYSCIGDFGVSRVFPLSTSSAGDGYVSLLDFDANILTVQRNQDHTALVNGIGVVETWPLIRSIASPVPFTCGQTLPPIDPRSRDLVCRINPNAPSCGR